MKKNGLLAALFALLLLPALVLAEGPALMTSLPEDALLVENVEFEDGDFIRTYHIADGATVQMLRYGAFDMTLDDLAEGEWTGYTAKEPLALGALDGYPAEGVHLMLGEAERTMDVYIVLVYAQNRTLIYQAVLGEGADLTQAQEWLSNLQVIEEEETQNG